MGFPRREFLYDIRFWEARRIIRGYRKRNRLTQQLLAENIFATIHVMRESNGKTVRDIFPQLFDDDDRDEPPITDEEVAELQELMRNINEEALNGEPAT